MTGDIRVLVVADDAAVRRGLQLRLAIEPDLVVVGATDGAGAVEAARLTRPAAFVLDVALHGDDGVEVSRRLAREVPGLPGLVLVLGGPRRAEVPADDRSPRVQLTKAAPGFDVVAEIRRLAEQHGCAARAGRDRSRSAG